MNPLHIGKIKMILLRQKAAIEHRRELAKAAPRTRDARDAEASLRTDWKRLLCAGGIKRLGPCEHWRGTDAPQPCAILGRGPCESTPADHYQRVLLFGGHPDKSCRWWTERFEAADLADLKAPL